LEDTRLEPLHPADRERLVDVVFVHGLEGDGRSTWANGIDAYWPQWISDDCPQAGVWVCSYPSTVVDSGRNTLSIKDLADNLAHRMRNQDIGERPVIFVAHSMGGLITKHILHGAATSANPEFKRLWLAAAGIAFLATPHAGSDLATWKSWITNVLRLFWPGTQLALGSNADELPTHAEHLRVLNGVFRNYVAERHRTGPRPRIVAYVEKLPTKGIAKVVDPHSADPQLAGIEVIQEPYDHLQICKFASRERAPFGWVLRQIKKTLDEAPTDLSIPRGAVLVSYPRRLNDPPGRNKAIVELVRALRTYGFTVECDVDFRGRRSPDWTLWRIEHMKKAHTILVVGDEAACEAFDDSRGEFSGATLTRDLYEKYARPESRFLPLLLDQPSADAKTHLPEPLRTWYAGHRFPSGSRELFAAICDPPV
jgi:predicted alpha/beta hydrolase family esterase